MAAMAVALVATLAPRPVAAQISGDVGVTLAPAFLHYLDVDPVCCPASAWGAVGSGRWRAHVDYLRGTRKDETLHEVNVLAAWRFLVRNGARASLLFGAYMRPRPVWFQVGAALDWPVWRRLFVRADARLTLLRVGMGLGSASESDLLIGVPGEAWAQRAYADRQFVTALHLAAFHYGDRIREINRWALND